MLITVPESRYRPVHVAVIFPSLYLLSQFEHRQGVEPKSIVMDFDALDVSMVTTAHGGRMVSSPSSLRTSLSSAAEFTACKIPLDSPSAMALSVTAVVSLFTE